METPSVTDTFAPGRRIGLSATHWDRDHFVGAGIFGDEVAVSPKDDDKDVGNRAERLGWSVRGVYRPFVSHDASRVFHLGFNYLTDRPQSDEPKERVRYRTRPEAHFVDYKVLHTGWVAGTEDMTTWGLEVAGKWDRLNLQSEYMESTLGLREGQDPEFSGWYAQASYFLTDDRQSYNLEDGEFGSVMPENPWGAFELAIRYSTLDLNDSNAGVLGGESKSTTVGLNWYANNNIIIRTNYIYANLGDNADGDGDFVGDDVLSIYGMRIEYLF